MTGRNFPPRRNPNVVKWNLLFDCNKTEWISFTPKLGLHVYPCYACRDMFASKNSFLDHVNRRVMILKFACKYCKSIAPCNQLIFYNPCSFLLHARQHYGLNGGKINLENLHVTFLPFGLGGLLPDPNIPLIYYVKDDEIEENVVINSRFYSPIRESKGGSVIQLVSNELVFYYTSEANGNKISMVLKQISSNIPRCKFVEFNDQSLVSLNLSKSKLIQKSIEACTKDVSQTSNETGKITVQSLRLGVEQKCSECKEIMISSLENHYLKANKPYKESLKCKVCKYIAPTKCSLRAHERIHDDLPPYVCPECGTTFQDSKLLNRHLEEICFHLAKQVRFRCSGRKCGKIFAQTSTFSSHFSVHTVCMNKCTICNEAFNNQIEFLTHSQIHDGQSHATRIFRCKVCVDGQEMLTEESLKEHIVKHAEDRNQFLYIYVCKYCRSYFRSTPTFSNHLSKCNKFQLQSKFGIGERKSKSKNKPYRIIACVICKNLLEYIPGGEYQSVQCFNCGQVHTVPTETSKCLLCQQIFSTQELMDHFRYKKCKYDNPLVLVERLADLESSKSDDNKRKRKRTLNVYLSKSKKLETPRLELDTEPESITPFDGTYHCNVCKFSSTIREEFHEHILEHRDVCTAYQCMECGQCFVVKPSLIKHLMFYHQITDTEKYFDENNCFDKNAVKELESVMRLAPGESKEPVGENQCRVCLKEFKDSNELDKHFRIHGMAFLLKNSK